MTEDNKPARPKKLSYSVRRSVAANEAAADPTVVQSSAAESVEPRASPDSPAGKGPRFHFFIVDSGWDTPCARVIRDNLDMITRFQHDDPLFILTQEQSTALMRRHPHLIGKDPILIARDLRARGTRGGSEYHGFHLNLGMIRESDKAVAALRKFLHLLAAHRQSANIEQDVEKLLHHKGLTGAIEVLRLGAEAMAG